jgi:hypothetical protein
MTGDGVPAGTSWHRDLRLLAATPAPGLRTAVISESTQCDLKNLLAFRHAARNAYADERPHCGRSPQRRFCGGVHSPRHE